MAKTSLKVRASRKPKFKVRGYKDANVVAAFIRSIKNLVFAVFASAKWHMLENYQVSPRPLGNTNPTINYGGPLEKSGNHFEKG